MRSRRRLARAITGADAPVEVPATTHTTGHVEHVNTDGTVDITVRSDPAVILAVETDSNYVPTFGDYVHLSETDGVFRVLGKSGTSPAVFAGIRSATVTASESTTSTTYTDLTTLGPQVTVTVGSSGLLLVGVSARLTPGSGSDGVFASFALAGPTTVAAADASGVSLENVSGSTTTGRAVPMSGLAPGSYLVTGKYRTVSGASGTFANRTLWALPM